MVNVYTNEQYAKSYTELSEILRFFSKSDLIKIPKDKINRYNKDKDKNYKFSYNPKLKIKEQNISKLTKILLANLYIEYLADEDKRQYIKNKDAKELENIQRQKQEKYDIQNIFDKRKDKKINDNVAQITSLTVIHNKESIMKKIFYKIKSIFKLT